MSRKLIDISVYLENDVLTERFLLFDDHLLLVT